MGVFVVALVLGIGCAAVGGDRFVRGTVGVSAALRIPPGIVGATVAAFATSSPELTVAVVAASRGNPAISLGDATGSSLANLGLVLGVAALLTPVVADWADLRRDLPTALGAALLLGVLASDGSITRQDAAALLVVFAAWLAWSVLDARRGRATLIVDLEATIPARRAAMETLVGLALLIAAGWLVVSGTRGLADFLGLDDFVAGAVFVAVGTSTPELATVLIAVRRGHADIGLGALLGSNIFNMLFIVGVAGSIAPITSAWREIALTLAFVVVATLAAVPNRRAVLDRRRGVVLLAIFTAYVVTILVTH